MNSTLLYRAAVAEATAINVAAGTARLSFSSEHPVLRRNDPKYGTHIEILSHAPGDVNNAIVMRGAPVCFDHRDVLVIGAVQPGTFEIGSDRKARATIQLDEEWRPYLRKVRDGEAPNSVSVGYSTIAVLKREQGADKIPILTFSWLPEEISLLTKGNPPADPKVGIGRSAIMKNSIDELLTLALSGARRDPDDDYSDVSLVETINQLDRQPSGRVREMFDANARIGGNAVSHGVPFSLFGRKQRDLEASIFPSGGAFVPTVTQPGIPLLFNRSVTRGLGARFITGLSGNPVFPRATTAALVSALGEIDPMLSSDIVTAASALKPCRASAVMVFGKQLLDMSGPGIETYFRDNIGDAIATKVDYLCLFGQGGNNEPLGLTNTVGVQSTTYGGSASFNALVAQKQALATANIPEASFGFALSPSARGRWEEIPKIAGYPVYLCENDRALNCPVLASNQIPAAGPSIMGAWRTLLVLIWGNAVDLTIDRITLASSGEVRLSAHIWFNVIPLYPQAFVVSADPANQ